MDDRELVDRWCTGDNSAGEELFKRHFDSIYSFFETKCPSDADELTQATFVACVSAKDRFRGHSSFRTFMFAIARFELLRMLRTRARTDTKLDFEVSSIAEIVTTPATRLARDQEHRQLVAILQELPVDQQTLLELHYREELGIDALSEVFEVSAQVIRTRLHRARKALRERLERVAAAERTSLERERDWAGRLTNLHE